MQICGAKLRRTGREEAQLKLVLDKAERAPRENRHAPCSWHPNQWAESSNSLSCSIRKALQHKAAE